MKETFKFIFIPFLFLQISCIDRDTIAGTGKESPDSMVGAGGDLQNGVINSKLSIPLMVKVLSANGRPVRGVVVEFSVVDHNAIFSDTNVTTNGDGIAQTVVTFGAKADSVYIYASVAGLKGSPVKFSLLSVSSNPTKIESVIGNSTFGTVGELCDPPLQVKVTDFYNNPVTHSLVYFSTSNGVVIPTSAYSDSFGIATSNWKLDSTAGSKAAQATSPSVLNGTVNFSGIAYPLLIASYLIPVTKDTLIMMEDSIAKFELQAKAMDKYKNVIYHSAAVPFFVQFSITKGRGTVTPGSAITNSNGVVTAKASIETNLQSMRVTANAGSNVPMVDFYLYRFSYLQFDSLRSGGGNVTLYWQKNPNPFFINYTVQRCVNSNFDNTATDVKVISDENVISTNDNTAAIGNSFYYRLKVKYINGFYFYSDLQFVTVNP